MERLSDLTAPAQRLALVGLAKNTGKTVALTALLGELAEQGRSVGVTSPVTLPPRFALTADETQIAELLKAHPGASRLIATGAVPEPFLEALVRITRRRGRKLTIVASDSTRVFLSDHAPEWYRRQGCTIHVEHQTALMAITVNPVAPQSHRFDSAQLRAQLSDAIPDIPVLDVLDQPA